MGRQLTFKTQQEESQTIIIARDLTTLPIWTYVQIYPRVSTPEQKKNVSAEMQQDKKFALRCGWSEELIIMDTRDLGLSGQKRMQERPAFADMITRIAGGKIKIIIAASVSRLFRDRWGVEYGRFMEICYTYGVRVVIPNKTRTGIERIYDFSVRADVDAFRDKCEESWAYIEDHVGMMNACKNEEGYAGCWVGQPIPSGFSVDLRELINGEKNPNYKKYVPYVPWAIHVARLTERYRELAGNLNDLFRELERTGFLFPPLDGSFPKEIQKCVAITAVYENPDAPEDRRIVKGYKIASLSGLAGILRNPANIGHYVYKGIIRYNNHPAIVLYMDFIYAFNRLSSTNLDGTQNVAYQERSGRYVKRHSSEKPAFLRNHIRPENEQSYASYTEEARMRKRGCIPFYSFYKRGVEPRQEVFTVSALDVDRLFLSRFVERLQTPVAQNEFADFLEEESAEHQAYLRRVKELEVHIEATKSILAKLVRRLTIIGEDDEKDTQGASAQEIKDEEEQEREFIKTVKKAHREHTLELARLEAQHEQLVTTGNETEKRRSFKKLMRDAGEAWEEVVTREDIIELVDLFVVKVALSWISPQFFILTIYWKDDEWETDHVICFKGGLPSPHWTTEEEDILREHYPTASGKTLIQMLPLRSLMAIQGHASIIGIRRAIAKKKEGAIRSFCLRDLEIIEEYGLDMTTLHWKVGASIATPWHIFDGGNLDGACATCAWMHR